MSRLSISSSFLVYCHLRCSLDGNLVKYLAKSPGARVTIVSDWQPPGSEKGAWNILCGNNAANM